MKTNKFLGLLLTAIICIICFFGCTQGKPNSDIKDDNEDNDITTNSGNIESIGGEAPLTTIGSYSEYLSFVNSKDLPKNFVNFEKISQFGEFQSIVFLSEARYGDYSSYMYNIIDSIGEEVIIYIDHKTDELSTENSSKIITDADTNNMRTVNDSKSGTFTQSGLKYTYVQGKLLTISWSANDVNYTIMCNTNNNSIALSEYPDNTSTPIAKLLSVKEATKVVDSIVNDLILTE